LTGTVRAFVALELDAGFQAALLRLADELGPRLPGLRLVRPEGVHLTLRFLGPATAAQLESLGAALAAAARESPVLQATGTGLGLFPERGQPRVLFVGLEAGPALTALQAACEAAAVRAGFAPEARPFRAHVTLGRFRDRARRPAMPAVALGETSLRTLVLLRSELGPGGAAYTALGRWALGASDPPGAGSTTSVRSA
jgi:2'-5' RNA ligase